MVPVVDDSGYKQPAMRIWVTKTNHEWVAEETGLSREVIQQHYNDARAEGVICTLIVYDRETVVRVTDETTNQKES